MTITTAAGSSNTGVCSGGYNTTSSSYVEGECSVVTVALTDPSGDQGPAFDPSQDSVTLTYEDGNSTQVSQQTASVNSSGDATFALTPSTPKVNLSATSSSADGSYSSGSATAPEADAPSPPAPTVTIQEVAGNGTTVCSSASPTPNTAAQMVVGECNACS